MIRSLAESALRGISFRRRLPSAFGSAPIVVSPSCGLRYLRWDLAKADSSLFSWVTSYVKQGAVVWDVGANLGLFTFAAAARAGKDGKVIAFEPDLQLVSMLRRSCVMQPPTSANVTVLPVACGRAVEPRTFHLAARSRAANYLEGYGSSQAGGTRSRQTVMAVSLDWALAHFPKPDLVKINVECAECEVLAGARELLATARPVILCEVGGDNSREAAALFHAHRYRVADAEKPDTGGDLEMAPWNTLAMPL